MTKINSTITAAELKSELLYNADNGTFTWLKHKSIHAKQGAIAGRPNHSGYILIIINGTSYRAHRLAWLYVHGVWPTNYLDHINGDRADNRIANLRECTIAENAQNSKKAHKDSRTGLLGIRKSKNKWQARICVAGKQFNLGLHETPEAAHAAYIAAKTDMHPFFSANHGDTSN
jgi:hypothetical protein